MPSSGGRQEDSSPRRLFSWPSSRPRPVVKRWQIWDPSSRRAAEGHGSLDVPILRLKRRNLHPPRERRSRRALPVRIWANSHQHCVRAIAGSTKVEFSVVPEVCQVWDHHWRGTVATYSGATLVQRSVETESRAHLEVSYGLALYPDGLHAGVSLSAPTGSRGSLGMRAKLSVSARGAPRAPNTSLGRQRSSSVKDFDFGGLGGIGRIV